MQRLFIASPRRVDWIDRFQIRKPRMIECNAPKCNEMSLFRELLEQNTLVPKIVCEPKEHSHYTRVRQLLDRTAINVDV
eukprot:774467-Rhodomonas_salina.1